MVTLKNGEVLNALMALRRLDEVKLDAPTTLKVVKLNRVLSTHWDDVNKVREALVKEHALLDEQGEPKQGEEEGSVLIDPDKKAAFEASVKALFEDTLDVEDKMVLSVEKDFTGTRIEPAVFLGLGALVA